MKKTANHQHGPITLIVAMSPDRVIGFHNHLPWHLPADLQHFRRITMGKPVVMGRKTHESIGRVLPGRQNIILTRQPVSHFLAECLILPTLEAVLHFSKSRPETMIIGGATLFRQFMPYAEKLYITRVEGNFRGDTFFPDYPAEQWETIESEQFDADEKNPCQYSFCTLIRRTA